jgi:hypothetical protein
MSGQLLEKEFGLSKIVRLLVKAGDLVEITRASIGIPAKTVALVLGKVMVNDQYEYFNVQLVGNNLMQPSYRRRRYIAEDLKVIS